MNEQLKPDCEACQAWLIDSQESDMAKAAPAEVLWHLQTCAECGKAQNELVKLNQLLATAPLQQLSPQLTAKLDQLLTEPQENATRFRIRRLYRLAGISAAACLLIVFGIWLGLRRNVEADNKTKGLQREVEAMRAVMVLNALRDGSASQRITAVGNVQRTGLNDTLLIAALVKTLNKDSSVNVRLAALSALSGFADRRQIRAQLVTAIDQQKDPLVLVLLIKLLTDKKETKAIAPLRRLLNGEQDPEVIKAARHGLQNI